MLVFSLIIRFLLLTSGFLAAARPHCVFESETQFLGQVVSGWQVNVRGVRLNVRFYAENEDKTRAVFESEMRFLTKTRIERAHRIIDDLGPSWARVKAADFH